MAELDLGRVVGDKGDTGATPNVSATASVDANTGTPSVQVTKTGTTENPNFDFSFHNLKGEVADINSLCMFMSIPASGWSSTTDSDGYYTNTVQLSAEINTAYKPQIGQIGSAVDVQPTSAEKAAFNLVDVFHFANGSNVSQITAKAKTKPTTTFYIVVYAGSESITVVNPPITIDDINKWNGVAKFIDIPSNGGTVSLPSSKSYLMIFSRAGGNYGVFVAMKYWAAVCPLVAGASGISFAYSNNNIVITNSFTSSMGLFLITEEE